MEPEGAAAAAGAAAEAAAAPGPGAVPVPPLEGIVDDALGRIVSADALLVALKAAALAVLGLAAVRILVMLARRFAKGRLEGRAADLLVRGVRYAGFAVVGLNLFRVLGVDLSALLGAAGIAGIAVGFAAQTSMSNLISGLFLLSEKSFRIGDAIQVDAASGVVEAVDLLSVKLRTFDNRLVRIPNETLVKSNLVNASRYPIRRVDLQVALAAGADLGRAREVLLAVAADCPFALAEPEPLVLVESLGPGAVNVLFGPWIRTEDLVAAKNALIPEVEHRLRAAGIARAVQTLALREEPAAAAGRRRAGRGPAAAEP